MSFRSEIISPQTAESCPEVHELFQSVYADERGWIEGHRATLIDRFHDQSVYTLLWADELGAKDRLVGAARLVSDSSGGLPVEQFFPLGPLKRGHKTCEIQRLMVTAELRSKRPVGAPFGITARLMQDLFGYAVHDFKMTIMIADLFTDPRLSPINVLRRLGFEQLGCPFTDAELACAIPSVALVLSQSSLAEVVASGNDDKLFHYIYDGARGHGSGWNVLNNDVGPEGQSHM